MPLWAMALMRICVFTQILPQRSGLRKPPRKCLLLDQNRSAEMPNPRDRIQQVEKSVIGGDLRALGH